MKFNFLIFAFLAVGFYELSGGSDFDPVEARENIVAARIETQNSVSLRQLASASGDRELVSPSDLDDETVTRASLDLLSFDSVSAAESAGVSSESSAVINASFTDITAETAARDVPETTTLAAYEANRPKVELIGVAAINTGLTDISFTGVSTTASSANVTLPKDIRIVTGSLVNVRSGPGTNFGVVNQVSRNTSVEVIDDTGTGWVKFRSEDGDTVGWMADFLLEKS